MGKCFKDSLECVGKLSLVMILSLVAMVSPVPGFADYVYNAQETNLPQGVTDEEANEPFESRFVEGNQYRLIYKDVDKKHWAYPNIQWAVANKLMIGFKDRTFRPDSQITEAEFATLFLRMQSNIDSSNDKPISGKHWSQSFYDKLKEYEIPFRGYNDDVLKDTAITRGQVAVIVASKFGFNLSEEQAVYFMYENKLSKGVVNRSRTFESYEPNAPMTRAQAVTFLKSIENVGTKKITFNGAAHSNYKDSTKMIGVKGVLVDYNIKVSFDKFIEEAMLDPDNKVFVLPKLKVAKGSDGLWHVVSEKITSKNAVIEPGTKNDRYANFVDISEATMGIRVLENSVLVYKNVELPLGQMMYTKENYGMKTDKVIFMTSLDWEGDSIYEEDCTYTGIFSDKESFKKLSENLSKFGVKQSQIIEANKIVDKWYNNREDKCVTRGEYSTYILSKSGDKLLQIRYGTGNIVLVVNDFNYVPSSFLKGNTIYTK